METETPVKTSVVVNKTVFFTMTTQIELLEQYTSAAMD